MSRILKFRVWDGTKMMSKGFDISYDGFAQRIVGGETDGLIPNATVMQFTGLKDKTGREIYEGDVVEIKGIFIKENLVKKAVVVWVEWNAGFVIQEAGKYPSKVETDLDFEFLQKAEYTEVIGNIYENPELLDGRRGE